jgi:hypothetical protein
MYRLDDYKNNCCAVALHEVSGKSEDEVIRACLTRSKIFGRGRGMYDHEWTQAMTDLGLDSQCIIKWRTGNLTLKQFCDENPTGVHIVQVKRHLMVVRDGEIVDPNWRGYAGARRRVHAAYLIHNAAAGRYDAAQHKTKRAAASARRLPPIDQVTPVLVKPGEHLMELQPKPKKSPTKYADDPIFRFRKDPTTDRARSCFNYFVIELERHGGWMCLSECDQFGYTRKDFRNDARKGRIEIQEDK